MRETWKKGGRADETQGKTKLARLREAEAESDGETEPAAQSDGWGLRRKGERAPAELWVNTTHTLTVRGEITANRN